MPNPSPILGHIEVSNIPMAYTGLPGGGLVHFLNNLISLIITLAGIFTLVNFIIAGYMYLSSNNEPQKLVAANTKILQSLIGLAIVAIAYVVAGIVGYILFQDPTSILMPNLSIL